MTMISNSRAFTAEEEKRIVSELTTTSFNEGDSSYFVISKRWYTRWQRYVGGGAPSPRPGPISNHDDIIDTGRLLVEDEDYLLLPQRVWNTLLEWYNGGPPIPRTLIYLYLSDARDVDNVTHIRLAKQASIRELYDKVCAKKGVSQEKARIWDYFNKRKGKLLHPLSNKSIEESGLHITQHILLDVDGSSSAVNELALVPLKEPSGSGHSLSSTSLGKGLAGLVNLGNTCYMNTALQCLAHTPPILLYLYTHDDKDNQGELAKAFCDLLKELWSSSGTKAVAPWFFKTKLDEVAPQFTGYNQHDSHELLLSLLAGLRHGSDIANVCQGQCESSLVCPVCGERATTYDSFMCLSLPLPSPLEQQSISLLSCLEEYLAEEPLGPDNMWDCPECKEKRQANKKLDLWKLPEILVLHLKRFKTSKYFVKKIDTFVNFPINHLDLSKYVKKDKNGKSYVYELYAVSNHHGGIAVGHYTAYAKLIDDDDNKWYHFNDSHVSPVNESEIESKAAYLLFYRRVGSETATQSAAVSMTDMDYSS